MKIVRLGTTGVAVMMKVMIDGVARRRGRQSGDAIVLPKTPRKIMTSHSKPTTSVSATKDIVIANISYTLAWF